MKFSNFYLNYNRRAKKILEIKRMKSKVWVNDLKFWIYQAIFLTKIIVNFFKLIFKEILAKYTNACVYVDRNVKKIVQMFPGTKRTT